MHRPRETKKKGKRCVEKRGIKLAGMNECPQENITIDTEARGAPEVVGGHGP